LRPDEQKDPIKVSVDPELQPLIDTFLQHRREEIKILQEAFEHSDYEKIRIMGHTIKGVGGGYGFTGLSKIAASIELAAIQRNVIEIQNGLRGHCDYLRRVEVVYGSISKEPLIVCVDDEPSMLQLFGRTLTKNGFRVMVSLSGENTLLIIHRYKPDLILMDLKMPGLSGQDMCVRLQKSEVAARIPVLIVTGCREEERGKLFSSQDFDVLLKPFDLDVLVEKVREAVQPTSNRYI